MFTWMRVMNVATLAAWNMTMTMVDETDITYQKHESVNEKTGTEAGGWGQPVQRA